MVDVRRLRLWVRTARGALPAVIAASVTPAGACSESRSADGNAGMPSGTSGTSAGRGGSAGQGTGGSTLTGGAGTPAGGVGGSIPIAGASGIGDPVPPQPCRFTVELPPEGVPAEPGQICAAVMLPVDSNRAAHVRLAAVNGVLNDVMGFIDVAPSLLGMIVGTPVVEAIDATHPALLAIVVESVTPSTNGFTFRARWAEPLHFTESELTRVTIRVSLEVACDDAPQLVHAVTDVHLCSDFSGEEWVSSGSVCSVCRIIAEMAPSPIVPDQRGDDLPLSRVLRLRIVELARVSGTVVLLAEHDGGPGLEYEWHASAGSIAQLAPDVVALSAEEGVSTPHVQVAAFGPEAAAVASWSFNDEVA